MAALELETNQVHLWLAFEEEVQPESLLAEYRTLVSDDERLAERRFRFPADQRRFLLTRVLVRTVLSRYSDVPPTAWRFVRDEHGRPHVAPDQSVPGLPIFNLSHTQGLVACAVTCASDIGVDVEHPAARRTIFDIADRYFSPDEVNALRRVPAAHQTARFFEYWTLKESYIKARGKGLSIPLAQFGFRFEDDRALAVSFDAQLGDEPTRWKFWLYQPSVAHVAAVCVSRGLGISPTLVIRKVIPLRTDEPYPCEPLRESAPASDA